MALSDQALSSRIKEIYQKELEQQLKTPYMSFEQFTPKKEETKVSNNINLILSAEGLAKYIADLQELAPSTKHKMDERGNYVFDGDGDYVNVDIPLSDRKVEIGSIRLTEEGKFALTVSSAIFAKMEALYAQKVRIESYQAS